MANVGLCCFWGRGHLDPFLALGMALADQGHSVTCFANRFAVPSVQAAGLKWGSVYDTSLVKAQDRSTTQAWLTTLLKTIENNSIGILKNAPRAFEQSKIDALVVDQFEIAAGSVADHLRIPFATLALTPPIYLDRYTPPTYVGWPQGFRARALAMNERANSVIAQAIEPVLSLINHQRQVWGLPRFSHVNETVSRRAFLTTSPKHFDLPRRTPIDNLFYLGPFARRESKRIAFPWEKLDGKPLIYASLGTLRNGDRDKFELIVEACAKFDVQLVLTLGGGRLEPKDVRTISTNSIVVHFAPQRELLDRATLTITNGGANTTLDSLAAGVPLIAIPMTDDQPGVAQRVRRLGAGIVLPGRRVSVKSLARAIQELLSNWCYRSAALLARQQFINSPGATGAVEIIEQRVLHCPSYEASLT